MNTNSNMGFPEIADFARNFSVMIRVQGPDPQGLKMRKHAFHLYNSGKTTISGSGMILPSSFYAAAAIEKLVGGSNSMLVLTVASVIEPFLSLRDRDHISQAKPELIPGAQIDVLIERKIAPESDAKIQDSEALHWLPAELLTLVDIPESSASLRSLVEASSGSSEHSWEVGWSLALHSNGAEPFMDTNRTEHQQSSRLGLMVRAESGNASLMGKSTTRIALLRVSSVISECLPYLNISPSSKRGDLLLAMGAPFGILSPAYFCNSISVGSIANCYPPSSSHRSLLMADIRCLPGMEGGPVFGKHVELVGVLTRPLRQRGSGAEVQLVIPWEAIASACGSLLVKPQDAQKGIHCKDGSTLPHINLASSEPSSYVHKRTTSHITPPSPVEKATASICLITIDDGVWASGVLLNEHGLILTNAHLLEPWRFRKAAESEKESRFDLLFTRSNQTLLPKREAELRSTYLVRRNIRIRLDHMHPWIWCDARVLYVSKGPLDIALLQLEYVPDNVCPIAMDFSCPAPGSKAFVIGHGLFGPRCELLPSACVGVVAKVVKVERSAGHMCSKAETGQGFPAMIETTAAVHPGGSGGAVVNSDGNMIGLVTSNAKHGGGTVIPHLNFSIPCAALVPIFNFSRDMQDLSLLEDLDKPNEHLSSVWALVPPLSPKPPPPLPDLPPMLQMDKENDTKGSRFAKFIAERQQLLKNTSQDKVESVFKKLLPSKL